MFQLVENYRYVCCNRGTKVSQTIKQLLRIVRLENTPTHAIKSQRVNELPKIKAHTRKRLTTLTDISPL